MVANVDASDSKCRCICKIIARDLRLMASRLYRMAVTRPGSRAAITVTLHNVSEITMIHTSMNRHDNPEWDRAMSEAFLRQAANHFDCYNAQMACT
jgi:hypothetical protein